MMIREIGLLMVLTAMNPLGGHTQGIADIVEGLRGIQCVDADIKFSVTLPQNDTDITYDIKALTYTPERADRLSPCDYLIEWSLPTPSGQAEGFSAYFDGNHYRFRDERLQEYHLEWDSVPFLLDGGRRGIQTQAQFAELLPAYIAREISSTLGDSTYIYSNPVATTFDGHKALRLSMRREISGMTAMERDFIFDAATMLPLRIDTESNPGSITEQSILVDYAYGSRQPDCTPLSEQRLIEKYPEVFEKYRQSNFRIENLPGTRLPAFSLRATDGSRFTRRLDEPLPSPTVVAFLDPAAGFNTEIVKAVRDAVDALPYQATVIWAFAGNNIDMIEQIVPSARPMEHILTGSAALARDCGVTAMPVIVMADGSGVVKKVVLGFNNDLSDIVLQNMALIN